MSTMAPGAGGDPKQQLLERALGHLAEHGIGDISLRELAATGGTAGADAAHEAYVAALMTRQAQRAGTSGDAPA
jgi:hypothetical protein